MVQRRRMVYIVLFGPTPDDEEEIPETSILGVFSSMKKATEAIPEHNEDELSYFTVETVLNEIIDLSGEVDQEEVEKILMEQVKAGLVEQFIDENGNFVYEAVDKSKEE